MNQQDVINRARVKIGQTTLNQITFEMQYIEAIYDSSKEIILDTYWWSFARKQSQLNLVPTDEKVLNYLYSYYLPYDLAKIVNVFVPNQLGDVSQLIQYKIYGKLLATQQQQPLAIEYSMNKNVPDEFPAYFGEALALLLASQLFPVTTDNILAQRLKQEYDLYLIEAQSLDSVQNYPTKFVSQFITRRWG